MSRLSDGNIHLQRQLFPALEEEIGTLSQRERNFVRVLELANTPAFTATMGRCGTGRWPSSREALAKSYVAKAVWNLPSTAALVDMVSSSPHLRRLCGWNRVADIPHESVFSRTFAEFSERALPQQIHEGRVKAVRGDTLCGHVSRDSTAIDGREKPAPKKEAKPRKRQKRGRLERGRCASPHRRATATEGMCVCAGRRRSPATSCSGCWPRRHPALQHASIGRPPGFASKREPYPPAKPG